MITIEMILATVATLAGACAMGPIFTQMLKNWCLNPETMEETKYKKWSQALSWIVSLVLNAIVLILGIYCQYGYYQDFNVSDVWYWITFAANICCVALCSNGEWTYEDVKKFLEWLGLLKRIMPNDWKENEVEQGDDSDDYTIGGYKYEPEVKQNE